MKFTCLTDLLSGDIQARGYFLSLPTELQTELHRNSTDIHSASELYSAAENLNRGRNLYRGFENRSFYI